MARIFRRVFDASRPVYARRPFTAAGATYQHGDLFDWTRLAVAHRRARQMFDAGMLMHKDDFTELPEPEPQSPDAQDDFVVSPAPTIEQEMQDEDVQHIAAIAAAQNDGLDDLNLTQLREIADAEGVEYRVSRAAQRDAIRQNRQKQGAAS